MPPDHSVSPPSAPRSRWPWVVLVLGLALLFLVAALWVVQRMTSMAGTTLDKGRTLIQEIGHQAKTVAGAFRQQTIRQEFLTSSVTLTGTSRLQVATIQENEQFRRKERDSVAWGWISLPDIVVQADVPVEYTYYLDFNGRWEFVQEGDVVTVHAPPIQPNSPAPDVSQLKLYTVEGHLWQDDKSVRQRLQGSLSAALRGRAEEHVALVREIARRQLVAFVEKWLADSFSDGRAFQVKVTFPGENPGPIEEAPHSVIKLKE